MLELLYTAWTEAPLWASVSISVLLAGSAVAVLPWREKDWPKRSED